MGADISISARDRKDGRELNWQFPTENVHHVVLIIEVHSIVPAF
jgi:hypothetical protein